MQFDIICRKKHLFANLISDVYIRGVVSLRKKVKKPFFGNRLDLVLRMDLRSLR
jgi:hypothetical protein